MAAIVGVHWGSTNEDVSKIYSKFPKRSFSYNIILCAGTFSANLLNLGCEFIQWWNQNKTAHYLLKDSNKNTKISSPPNLASDHQKTVVNRKEWNYGELNLSNSLKIRLTLEAKFGDDTVFILLAFLHISGTIFRTLTRILIWIKL